MFPATAGVGAKEGENRQLQAVEQDERRIETGLPSVATQLTAGNDTDEQLKALARLFDVLLDGIHRFRRQETLLDWGVVGSHPVKELVPRLVIAFQLVESVLRRFVDGNGSPAHVNL